MKPLLLFLFITVMIVTGISQPQEAAPARKAEITPATDYHEMLTGFITLISKGRGGDAFFDLANTNASVSARIVDLFTTSEKFGSIINSMGHLNGFDVVEDKLVTPHIAYVIGFCNFQKQPLRLEFIFVKPEDKWIFNNIDYTLNVTPEIRRAAREHVVQDSN